MNINIENYSLVNKSSLEVMIRDLNEAIYNLDRANSANISHQAGAAKRKINRVVGDIKKEIEGYPRKNPLIIEKNKRLKEELLNLKE